MNRRSYIRSIACFALLILFILSSLMFISCAGDKESASAYHSDGETLALIAPCPKTDADYILIHGFLDTASAQGIPARLYTFDEATSEKDCANHAINDGCAGAVVTRVSDDTVKHIQNAGMPVISLFSEYEGINAVVMDDSDFYSEAALYLAEQLHSKGTDTGTILIYGADDDTAPINAFTSALSGDGYTVKAYTKGMDMTGVCGIYALNDTAGALDLSGDDIIVMGMGVTEKSDEQFSNGLCAISVEPVYDAAAQSVLSLKKLAAGDTDTVQPVQIIRRPIVTASGIGRYISERYRALLLFDAVTPSPAPTAIVPSDVPETKDIDETHEP